jgi:hypothetical protein
MLDAKTLFRCPRKANACAWMPKPSLNPVVIVAIRFSGEDRQSDRKLQGLCQLPKAGAAHVETKPPSAFKRRKKSSARDHAQNLDRAK